LGEVKSYPLGQRKEYQVYYAGIDILKGISEDKDKIHVGMEATGSLWENIYSFLEKKGYTLFPINPGNSISLQDVRLKQIR